MSALNCSRMWRWTIQSLSEVEAITLMADNFKDVLSTIHTFRSARSFVTIIPAFWEAFTLIEGRLNKNHAWIVGLGQPKEIKQSGTCNNDPIQENLTVLVTKSLMTNCLFFIFTCETAEKGQNCSLKFYIWFCRQLMSWQRH